MRPLQRLFLLLAMGLSLWPAPALATVLADVRGIVHDPQHRPIAAAHATLQSVSSDFHLSTESGSDGVFEFRAVRPGQYKLDVSSDGFASESQMTVVTSGTAPVLHFQLAVAAAHQDVRVMAQPESLDTESSNRTILVSREQIDTYAGVDQSNSFRIVTDFLPGAYMVHDQLHVRGGHQVTWAIDGVPLPNTNIASNVGPQFNPKDVDSIEEQSGSYSADYGDRTYGVFNVAPRTGFERNRQAEAIVSYGNYNATDDHLSFGDHNERFAWYASANGNRSDYGLEPPTSVNLHNQVAGGGGFLSLLYNQSPKDQLRLNGGFRVDYYQVPNDAEAQAAGVRNREREQDAFAILSWVHEISPSLMLTTSPFYHFNRAAFEGGEADVPSATNNRASNYEGGQISLSAIKGRNNLRAGIYAFAQQDSTYFAVAANDGSGDAFQQTVQPAGAVEAIYLQDQFKLTKWLTLNGGVRLTHFSGQISENAADPRAGAAITIPKLGWVAHGAYSRLYQPPPLDTLSGPLLDFAASQGVAFLPLHGERDQQYEVGLTIPVRNWIADFAYFRTGANNFFDHDVIGNSNIFVPLTIASARIRGYEASVRSPLVFTHYHAHLAYSNQQAQGFGGVNGGLTSFAPPPNGGFYLDHDQRNTLAAGVDGTMPWRTTVAVSVNYGSGFLSANGPAHLPGYTTVGLSMAKSFGENVTLRFSATNIADQRYQLDASNTFGGTHYADPRMMSVQLRYRFHF